MLDVSHITPGELVKPFGPSMPADWVEALAWSGGCAGVVLKPCCLWMTGYSGAGKTTLAHALRDRLNADGVVRLVVLDGDEAQGGMCKDLGSGATDRVELSRRMAAVAHMLVRHGLVVVVSTMSPLRAARSRARALFDAGAFIEVHVATPLETCMARDVKGLYRKARFGALCKLPGVDAAYEEPLNPEIRVLGEGEMAGLVSQLLAGCIQGAHDA
ncbi:adenylyl-sulfate kinase [Limnohabitans sp. DCL3]|uniref:adenylyl-sulfate kinase n=1 Tax=Limnohabitans sp. DCL3 TaxID=3374103 RepID=UPI003A87AA3A